MSESPEPSSPGNLEALVSRAVAERLDPVQAQLTTVGRALAILAQRVPQPQQVTDLGRRLDDLASRLGEAAPVGRASQGVKADELRMVVATAVGRTVEQAVRRVEEAAAADRARLLEQVATLADTVTRDIDGREAQADQLRGALPAAVEPALGDLGLARTGDVSRLSEKVEVLEATVAADAAARSSWTDELRQALAVAVTGAVAQVDQVHRAHGERILERIDALEEPLQREAEQRHHHADQLVQTVAAAVERAVAHVQDAASRDTTGILEGLTSLDAARTADAAELRTTLDQAIAQTEERRAADAAAVERSLVQLEEVRKADAARLLEQVATLAEAVTHDVEGREAQAEQMRGGLAAAVERALGHMDVLRTADAHRLLEKVDALEATVTADAAARSSQTDELRQALAVAVTHAVAKVDQVHRADGERILERIDALEEPLQREVEQRHNQSDQLVQAVAAAVERALADVDVARTSDAHRVLEKVEALEAPLVEQMTTLAADIQAEAGRRNEQAAAMLTTVDERLQALHRAGAQASDEREGRLVDRVEAVIAEHGRALVLRIDERTAAIAGLEAIPVRVAAEVQGATAAALTTQVEPLVARLVEAIDTLAHEGGRIEAMARGHAGEARAVEERVAALFTEVAERAETAVDRSRARISEGQVALGARFEGTMAELLSALSAATGRLEARLAESVEGLRAAGGHQNGALLDAVNRTAQQLGEAVAEVRVALFATGTDSTARGIESDQRAGSLAERLDSLRATVESVRNDPRLEALVVEQVAARDAQVSAIEAVAARIDQVGPAVARALLAEVERATRAANAAEEAVASLRPDDLRSALLEAAAVSAEEVRVATRRLDDATAVLAARVGENPSSLTAMEDLRTSQAILRAAVQDGAQKAELAVVDIRGLRERLAPHLAALADATTRRAEADQAGFDAVLARLDQLLAASQREP